MASQLWSLEDGAKITAGSFSKLSGELKQLGVSTGTIDKLGESIKRANPEVLRSQTAELTSEMKRLGATDADIQRVMKEMNSAGSAAKTNINGLNSSLRELGASPAQISKINEAIRQANPQQLQTQIQGVREEMTKLGVSSTEINKITSELERSARSTAGVREEVKQLGMAYAALSAAMTAAITKAVQTAAAFEQAMAKVKSITGATGQEFDKLRNQAMELGATTSFTASQAADAQSFLAMAGFKVNDIYQAMPGVLSLAAAGQMDLARTADIASNILTGFGLATTETTRVVDVMAKAMTTSNTNIEQLGYAMKYAAPIAAQAGVSIEEAAAAVGLLSNAGLQGEMAGTQLRAILLRLLSPSREAAWYMEKLGISAKDSSGNILPLANVLGQTQKAFTRLTEAQKVDAASTIAGTVATSGFLTLVNNGQQVLENYTAQLQDAGGTADYIAETQLDTLNGAFVMLKSALEGVGIAIGNEFIPAVRAITEWFTRLLTAITQMDPALRNAIVMFGVGTTAVLGLTAAVGALAIAFGALNISFPLLGAIALAVGGVTAVVGALTTSSREAAAAVKAHDDAQKSLNDTLSKSSVSRSVAELNDLREKEQALAEALEERGKLQQRINEIMFAGEDGRGTPAMLSEAMDINEALEEMDKKLNTMGYDGVEDATSKLKEMRDAIGNSTNALFEEQRAEIADIAAKNEKITTMEKSISRIKELSAAQKLDMTQKGELVNLVNAVKREYPGLNALQEEDGRIRVQNIDVISDQVSAEREMMRVSTESAQKQIDNLIKTTQAQKEAVNAQIENYKKLLQAMNAVAGAQVSTFADSVRAGEQRMGANGSVGGLVGGLIQQQADRFIEQTQKDLTAAYDTQQKTAEALSRLEKASASLSAGDFTLGAPKPGAGVDFTKPKKEKKPKEKKGKSPEELAAEARKKAYEADLKTVQFQSDFYDLSPEKQIAKYEELRKKHAQYLKESVDDARTLTLQIKRLSEEGAKARYDVSVTWIKDEERRMEEGGKTEKQIAEMKLSAWTRLRNRYKKDSDEYKRADEEVYKARKDVIKTTYEASAKGIDDEMKRQEDAKKTDREMANLRLYMWTKVRDRYAKDSEEYKKADEQVRRARKDLSTATEKEAKDAYDARSKLIDKEIRRLEDSGATEEAVAAYKIKAWTELRDKYTKDSEFYEKADEQVYQARKSYVTKASKVAEDFVKEEKKRIDVSKKAELEAIETKKKEYVKAQDEKISAIDALIKKEAELNVDADYDTKLAEYNKRIDELASTVGDAGKKEREDTIKERDRFILEHDRDLRKRELESQKDKLQKEKDAELDAFERQKTAKEKQYDALLQAFDSYSGDIKTIEAGIAAFRVSESANANTQILADLDTFIVQYNAKMAQVNQTKADAQKEADLAEYNANKDGWNQAKASGDTAKMAELTKRNQEIRDKYGIDKDTGKLQQFSKGGIVRGNSGEAVPVIAHAGEIILNPQQQAALWGYIASPQIASQKSSAPTYITQNIDLGVNAVTLADKADITTFYDERTRALSRLQAMGGRE